MHARVKEIITLLGLEAHPEGGWFKETFKSQLDINSPAVSAKRSAVTDIYFLLEEDQVSRFHRVMHDEIWHFYEGRPIQLIHFDPKSGQLKKVVIGPVGKDTVQKYVIPAGHWQAAQSTGVYSLAGCTVAPGFDFADFSFLDDFPEIKNDILKIDSNLSIFV